MWICNVYAYVWYTHISCISTVISFSPIIPLHVTQSNMITTIQKQIHRDFLNTCIWSYILHFEFTATFASLDENMYVVCVRIDEFPWKNWTCDTFDVSGCVIYNVNLQIYMYPVSCIYIHAYSHTYIYIYMLVCILVHVHVHT
jgi:hypothetical protein